MEKQQHVGYQTMKMNKTLLILCKHVNFCCFSCVRLFSASDLCHPPSKQTQAFIAMREINQSCVCVFGVSAAAIERTEFLAVTQVVQNHSLIINN